MENPLYYYYTDHNRFYNSVAMFAYAAYHTPDVYPKFSLLDDVFAKYDWTVEPAETFYSMMERRALQIREMYPKIAMFLSTGSDSITIYNIFKKLNIHIDEILICYNDDETFGHSPKAVQWILEHHTDATTKITAYQRDHFTPSFFQGFKETGLFDESFRWSVSPTRDSTFRYINRYAQSHLDTAVVTGVEKPVVIYKNRKWFASHLDKLMMGRDPSDGNTNVEHFYITHKMPELHIKQNHLLKNNAKLHIDLAKDWTSSTWASKAWQNYGVLNRWTGRDDGLILSNLMYQKSNDSLQKYNAVSLVTPRSDSIYVPSQKLVKHGEDPLVEKFLDALKYAQTDKVMMAYLSRVKLLDESKSLDRRHGIWGKFYDLGE